MKRTAMKRTGWPSRGMKAAPEYQRAQRAENQRLRDIVDCKVLAPATRPASYSGTTTQAIPKEPHTVNPHLRNLARGENCTGLRYGSYCHCDPATTVLAHTNTQADAKGMGYKAHDHMGAFLGFDCHAWLDQGNGTADERSAFMAAAQERTRERWAQIAADPMARPWKRAAAQWALDQLKEHA